MNTADNYFELEGKVALITGASSGLGEHFARTLAKAGCKVVATARRVDRLQKLCDEVKNDSAVSGTVLPLALDVTNADAISETLATVKDTLGSIQILINNAGIGKVSYFLDAEDADTQDVFETNQNAVWKVAQLTARQMVENNVSGSIINISSVLGLRVMTGTASYAVSKAAVIQMTKVMALELARHNIRANAIAPGYFSTEMNSEFLESEAGHKILSRSPMKRHGVYEELDGLVLLLSSERSKFITGTVIPVDGGHCIAGL